MKYIERRRWHPDYDSEYVHDEGLSDEVERMAMRTIVADAPHKPGAWITRHGKNYRLDQMNATHFSTGRYGKI